MNERLYKLADGLRKATGEQRTKLCLSLSNYLLLLVLVITPLVYAQTSSVGTVVGRVVDPSQAAIPDAQVTVTNIGTNAERVTNTDKSGEFSVPNLPPGSYSLRVAKSGFGTAVVQSFDVIVNETAREDVTLQVGTATQTVEVSAQAPLLESESATVGQAITEKQIVDLPLNGRNILQLATLAAGVSPQNNAQRGGAPQYGNRNEYVQVEGGRDSSTNYIMDGVYVRSLRFNNLSVQPSVDTIQEFNVLRNQFSTEYGQGQAMITMVTKSGTNAFHGDLYEFLRNDVLDAKNFFAPFKPEYRRNQFGGTAGGPIIKNKFFVFGGYEGLRTIQGQPQTGTVPDPTQLSGNFSALPLALQPHIPGTNTPFPGGRVPLSQFAAVLNPTIPAPNSTGTFNYVAIEPFLDNYDEVTFRADQVLSEKHTMFERYLWYNASQNTPAINTTTAFPQSGQNIVFGDTYSFSPTVVNELRLSYNRAKSLIHPLSPGGKDFSSAEGLQNLAGTTIPLDYGTPQMTISGFTSLGDTPITQGATENVYNLSDTVSKVFGHHTLRTGIQLQDRRFFQITEVPPNGIFVFTGSFTGNPLADYEMGLCTVCVGALGYSGSDYEDHTVGAFVNDVWRVTPKLTVNWGLRWDFLGPFHEVSNQEGNFDPASGKLGYNVVPANLPTALLPLVINQNGFYPPGIIHRDYKDWGPRVGIAYQLTNSTVIRTGYGIFYDNNNLNELQFTRLVPPFYGINTLYGQNVATLFPGINQVTSFPAPFAVNPYNRTPYDEQWNFSIQQSLSQNTILELAYTGDGGHHLSKRYNQNEAIVFGANPVYPYPQWQPGILTSNNVGNSSFNGLSVRVEKRYSNGFLALANFQYSKNIDDASGEIDSNDTAYSTNFALDRGLSSYNQKFRSSGSLLYDLPFGHGQRWALPNGITNAVLGNWHLSLIVSILSGFPNTPTESSTSCNCGSFVPQRVDAVKPGFGNLSDPTPNLWYDPTAFAAPPNGFQGTAGRDLVIGPRSVDVDFSAAKSFSLTERIRLDFRGEFFNILNHPNFGPPDMTINDPTAGAVTTAADGRTIQFGMKLNW